VTEGPSAALTEEALLVLRAVDRNWPDVIDGADLLSRTGLDDVELEMGIQALVALGLVQLAVDTHVVHLLALANQPHDSGEWDAVAATDAGHARVRELGN
jgi:hypothetical protein